MTGDYIARYRKRDKMDRRRRERLMRKIQKARALSRVEEVFSRPSWNKRFGLTARLRVTA